MLSIFSSTFASGGVVRDTCFKIKDDKKQAVCLSKIDRASKPGLANELDLAYKALHKIDDVVQMNANFDSYSRVLIDEIPKVKGATRDLPDGPLKASLNESADAFVDYRDVWGASIAADYVSTFKILASKTLEKYAVDLSEINEKGSPGSFKKMVYIAVDPYLAPIVKTARERMARAESLR